MPAISALTIHQPRRPWRAPRSRCRRAGRGLKRLVERVKNRRDAMRLAELDDRMLADIGLSRSDLRDAFAVPAVARPGRSAGAPRHRAAWQPTARGFALRDGRDRLDGTVRDAAGALPPCLNRLADPPIGHVRNAVSPPAFGCSARRPPAGAFFLSVDCSLCSNALASKRGLH